MCYLKYSNGKIATEGDIYLPLLRRFQILLTVLFRRYVSQDRVAYYLFQSNMAQKSLIA